MAVPRFNEDGRPDDLDNNEGPVLPEDASGQEQSAAWEAMTQERMFWLL